MMEAIRHIYFMGISLSLVEGIKLLTSKNYLPDCSTVALNTAFLNGLDIYNAIDNSSLIGSGALDYGFLFIPGQLRGLFIVVPYNVANIRVKGLFGAEQIIASLDQSSANQSLVYKQMKYLLFYQQSIQ